MSLLTSNVAIWPRRAVRRSGLKNLLTPFLRSTQYERVFSSSFFSNVRTGDIVWDIGANVGWYSRELALKVGPSGRVVAFEPVPSCYRKLHEICSGLESVIAFNFALGSRDDLIDMVVEDDPLASTHHFVYQKKTLEKQTVAVPVRSAESFVVEHPYLFPNLIKVDVEGQEGAVLEGMGNILLDPRLRCIGIEIHFGLLDARGESHRPKKIEDDLKEYGFSVRFTDMSHILAIRD